jgi:hypothetical protein
MKVRVGFGNRRAVLEACELHSSPARAETPKIINTMFPCRRQPAARTPSRERTSCWPFCFGANRMSEFLNVAQVAAILNVSPDTVVRRFKKERGVIDVGNGRRCLRIPKVVVERVVGRVVTVPVETNSSFRRIGRSLDGAKECGKNDDHNTKESAMQTATNTTNELSQFQKEYLEESGYGTPERLAHHLIKDGWCPESVEQKTGLDAETVERLFKRQPVRAREWDLM